MATFGENLRREREMRGVTLEEISDATKIAVRTLAALEADDFSKLPGGIFTRSFIRAYAKYLGLDEEAILAELQQIVPGPQQTDLHRMTQQRPPRTPQERSRARLVGLLIVLVLVAGGYTLSRYAHRIPFLHSGESKPASSPPSAPSSITAASLPANPAAVPGATSGTTPNAPATEETPATETSTASQPLVLQVAATGRAWVAVESDGKPVSQRIMEPNEIQTFRATTSFDVITGNAQGIVLTLNGKTLAPLGQSGEIKKVHLTLDNVQNITP